MDVFVRERRCGCGQVEICSKGRVPGHMAHISIALQRHVDVGGRAGTCEKDGEIKLDRL